MKTRLKVALNLLFFFSTCEAISQPDFLKQAWEKQAKPLGNQALSIDFSEITNELGHSFYPWQKTVYQSHGKIWIGSTGFAKQDTLQAGERTYYSTTMLTENEMLLLDYGDTELSAISQDLFQDQIFKTARYHPGLLLQHFISNRALLRERSDETFVTYSKTINQTLVNLYIDKNTGLVSRVVTLHDDELFGDAETAYSYSTYVEVEGQFLALDIQIKKINGKLVDEVHLTHPQLMQKVPALLDRPENYALKDPSPVPIELTTSRYNDYLHLVQLKHTDDRALIVEFVDFLLVAEAPLNSENGELIISEARKIAPDKPIRYFVFGHYHPHYLGGIRPFVHKGAHIITSKQDQEYVSYLVNSKHTLNPDSLHMQPKPLIFEEIKDSLTISDGQTEMVIYYIGEKSAHTLDYLIYYFPKDKILFEDDLVWIPEKGETGKADKRQAGLYRAIKDLGIEVHTIIQSWPVADYGVKTIIPFEDLEKSMQADK